MYYIMVWKEPNRKRRASDNNNSKKPSDPLHIRRQVTHKWPTLRWPTAAVLNPSQKVTHLGWVTFMMYLFDWPLFLSLFFLFLFPFPSLPFFFPSSLLFLLFFFLSFSFLILLSWERPVFLVWKRKMQNTTQSF